MEARELPELQPQAFELVLRIRHPSMDPEEISAELQISAEHSFKAGEPRKSAMGSALSGGSVYGETYWLATLNPGWWPANLSLHSYIPGLPLTPPPAGATESLSEMAKTALGRALSMCATRFMRPHRDFFRRIQAEGGQVRLLVELNTAVVGGFTLTPELGREINAVGVPIDFEFAPTN
jgi:hypothetical protein